MARGIAWPDFAMRWTCSFADEAAEGSARMNDSQPTPSNHPSSVRARCHSPPYSLTHVRTHIHTRTHILSLSLSLFIPSMLMPALVVVVLVSSRSAQLYVNNVLGVADRFLVSSGRSTHSTRFLDIQHTIPLQAAYWQPLSFRLSRVCRADCCATTYL